MKDNHIKLGGFSIAKVLKDDETSANAQIGTQDYFAPEIVNGENYDYRIDIWDLGIILYEMINFKKPFQAKGVAKMLNNIVNGKINEIENKTVSNELIELIYTILKVNPLERPEIKDIVGKCKEILEKIKKE